MTDTIGVGSRGAGTRVRRWRGAAGTAMVATVAALPLMTGATTAKAADVPQWSVIEGLTDAWAINDDGQVVGLTPNGWVRRDPSGAQHPIIAGGVPAWGYEIDAAGRVLGMTEGATPTGGPGFLWDEGDVTYFPSLNGLHTTPQGISDAGHVVGGTTGDDPAAFHAWLWTDAGGMVDLGPGNAQDVNDAGVAVGAVTLSPGSHRAAVWFPGQPAQELGVPGTSSTASFVNDAGLVVGSFFTAEGAKHLFTWTQAGGVVDRGTMPDGVDPLGLTDDGVVLVQNHRGGMDRDEETAHFLWSATTGYRPLELTGTTAYFSAHALNNRSEVVGGVSLGGGSSAFRWQPTGGSAPADPPAPPSATPPAAPAPARPVPVGPRFTG